MNDITTQLTEVLSDMSFFEDNRLLEDKDTIIAAIQARVPDATAEEIDAYLTKISSILQQDDTLSEDDLDNVSGGIIITAAVIGTALKCVATAATVGGLIGSAIWYWKNR